MAEKTIIRTLYNGSRVPVHPETELDQVLGLARQNSTAYAVGNIALVGALITSCLILQCTTAGTTAAIAPDFSGKVEGDTIADGTVVWTCKNILSGGGVQVGFIAPYAGTGLAEGWLDCDGSAVSRTMYPDLFAAIGTTWGAGDGSTTFNLPTSEDLVLQGASATNPVGTYLSAGLPNITGGYTYARMSSNSTNTNGALYVSSRYNSNYVGTSASIEGTITLDASRANSIYGNSDTVQPPAACVRFMIKYE